MGRRHGRFHRQADEPAGLLLDRAALAGRRRTRRRPGGGGRARPAVAPAGHRPGPGPGALGRTARALPGSAAAAWGAPTSWPRWKPHWRAADREARRAGGACTAGRGRIAVPPDGAGPMPGRSNTAWRRRLRLPWSPTASRSSWRGCTRPCHICPLRWPDAPHPGLARGQGGGGSRGAPWVCFIPQEVSMKRTMFKGFAAAVLAVLAVLARVGRGLGAAGPRGRHGRWTGDGPRRRSAQPARA